MAMIVDEMYLFLAPHFFDLFIKDKSEAESTIESFSLPATWPFTSIGGGDVGGSSEKRAWMRRRCWARSWRFDSEMEDLNYAEVLEAISLVDVRRRFIEALALQFGRPVEADSVGILGM
ncbi:hypothetical protein ACFX19_020359 [Malus domestica]